jgi:hypothetical protein
MLKILPALEGYVLANIATQNLFGSNPVNFLLGDLNSSVGSNPNALALAMGPNHQGISLKELLMNSMSTMSTGTTTSQVSGKPIATTTYGQTGGVLDAVQQNFMNNMGNIIVGTAMSTAGFRIAKKVLRKPINMANRSLRQFGLGSTVQF